MIIDSKSPRASGGSPQDGSTFWSPQATTSHCSPLEDLQHPESSESPIRQVTGNLPASAHHPSNSLDRELPAFDDEHSNDDPPPAYEVVSVSPTPHRAARRVLKRRTPSVSSRRSSDPQIRIDLPESAHTSPLNSPELLSPSFQRSLPEVSDSTTTCERLPAPFVIQAKTSKHQLPDLFATVGIPALHRHDVREEDWERLLQEMASCAQYSSGQRVVAGVLPITRWLGPPGSLASLAIKQGMRKQKISKMLELLDAWNGQFFGPRKLEVILCKGDKCKSGRRMGFLAPDRMDAPPTTRSQTRGHSLGRGCCRHSHAGLNESPDKAYRLVVVSVSY